MHRKLARHFAQDACDNAIKKLSDLFRDTAGGEFDIEATLKEIQNEEEQDLMKKNQMSGIDRMKARKVNKSQK